MLERPAFFPGSDELIEASCLPQVPMATMNSTYVDPRIAVAKRYFEALYAGNFERVLELTSPEMTFSDPTAEGQSGLLVRGSREEFLDYVRANASAADAEARVDRAYVTGKFVMLYIEYAGDVAGESFGAPGRRLEYNGPGVTILTIEQGKVVGHLDYCDYESINAQFGDQTREESR